MQLAERFLSESGMERYESDVGCVIFGHVGPKASFPGKLKLEDFEEWCLELCRRNMEGLYDDVWGWDDREKLRQFQMVNS